MGTGVLDSQSGNQVYFPETKGPTTSDDIERTMNDLNSGTQTTQTQKPNWVQQHIIDPIVNTAKQYNLDPVMSVKAFGGGFFKAEGLGQLIGTAPKYPAQNPENATPFAPTIQQVDRVPTPTVPEQEMYRAKAPFAYLAGQFGGVGTDFAIANLATDGLAGVAGPVLAKVPMIQKFLQGINTAKEAGTLSEQGVALGEAAAKTPLTWGTVGAVGSVASQKQSEGKIDWGKAFKDFAVSTGMGVATEGVFSFMSKPLSEIGSTQDLMVNTGKKMLASGAVAGAIVASGGGSPKETAFASGLGVLLGGLTLHGDIEGVKESVMAEHLNLKARYIVSQTGEDPTSAYQKATEQTMNDAEEAINEAHSKVIDNKPVIEDKRVGASKVFTDGYDPKLFDHLSQFFSPDYIVRMDKEERVWLGNQPLKDLNAWAEQHKEIAFDQAQEEQARSQSIEDDAKRARGIAVDKNVLDEVSGSKELMTNVITKTLNQVTEGEKTTTRGESNAKESGTQVGSRGEEKGIEGETRTGIRVRNNDEEGIAQGKEVEFQGKKYKSAEDLYKANKAREGGTFMKPEYFDKGNPGIGELEQPSKDRPLLQDEDRPSIVYRDKEGNPQGSISFYAPKGKLETREDYGANIEVHVNPEFRKQGIATKLYEKAKSLGYDLDTVEGRVFTKEGAALTFARLSKKSVSEGEVNNPKVAKSSEDISKELAKRGLANLSDEDKAHFESTSYKGKTEELTELMRTDPMKAEKIATGEEESSLSPSEKQLLFNMVKLKALDEDNSELGVKLARSSLNVERSEAAKTLGASGFDNGDFGKNIDPIKLVKDVEKDMSEKTSKTIAKKISKEIGEGVEKVKKESVPKQSEFDKFIKLLRC